MSNEDGRLRGVDEGHVSRMGRKVSMSNENICVREGEG